MARSRQCEAARRRHGALIVLAILLLAATTPGCGVWPDGTTQIVIRNASTKPVSVDLEIVEIERNDRTTKHAVELAPGASMTIDVEHGIKHVWWGPRESDEFVHFDQWNGETVDLEFEEGGRLKQVFGTPSP